MHQNLIMAIGSSEIGGAQKVFKLLVRELVSKNIRVTVLLPEGPLVKDIRKLDVPAFIVDYKSLIGLTRIYRIIKQIRPTSINTHLTNCNFLLSHVNVLIGAPMVCTFHNQIIHIKLNLLERALYPIMYHFISAVSDSIVVVSKFAKQDLIINAGIRDGQIKVIYNGIDIKTKKHNSVASKKFIFACIGRLSAEKGQKYFIEAIHYIKEMDFECWLIGDGPLKDEIEKLIHVYGISDKIKMFGFQKDVKTILQQVNAVVVPSLSENLGLSILEAFSFKKGVIGTDVGGIPELVEHKVSGLIVPPGNSYALSQAMVELMNNPNDLSRYGEQGYLKLINGFTAQAMGLKTLAHIKYVANLR